ncbi:uncharacterized protein LOC144420915 [Styela clava]
MANTKPKCQEEDNPVICNACDHVQDFPGDNEEEKSKKEQELHYAIQSFRDYIRSVQQHDVIRQHGTFMTPEDRNEIHAAEQFLDKNPENLRQIREQHLEFKLFVENILNRLKNQAQEKERRRKQKLHGAIQSFRDHILSVQQHEADKEKQQEQQDELIKAINNFRQYIQSVQTHEAFAEYEKFMSSDDKIDVDDKCLRMNTFLSTNRKNLHIKQIEDKRTAFESFIQSVVTKLQRKAQMATYKIKQERRKQWDKANRNIRKLLNSVRTQITNRHLGAEFSQYIENIRRTCNEAEDWLQRYQKTITVEELESKYIEVKASLKNLRSGLKQEIQAIEAVKEEQAKEERKLTEARDNLVTSLASIRQMCASEQIAGTKYADTLNALCSETGEYLKSEEISVESVQSKHVELRDTVEEIKQSMSKMKQEKEAEANIRQKAFNDLCKYIDEVHKNIATEEENDESTRPHINMITNSCKTVLEWIKKYYDQITSDTITSKQRNLRRTIEDIYDKMQAGKNEAEEIFRQQVRTAVHDYIDYVCKSLEAERETDKTIVQCIDTIHEHCTNVFEWINENYHQITGKNFLSEFDKLQKTVNDIFNSLRERKIEVEAERERQRAETIRKRAEVINNLRAHISEVRSRVVFKKFKNRLTEEDLRLIFSQCNIAERHIEENSDTIQLEVQYLDIRKMTEDVYKKLKRIDTLEKTEVARRQAEERRKKADMSQKLKNYIDRVQRLIVFEPLASRLTKNDEARIQSECIKANQFLIAENLNSAEIEKKCRELEEYVQIIYKKLKTWEEIANKCKDDLVEWNNAKESLSKCINYWKQLVIRNRGKDKLTDKYFNKIVEMYTDAENWFLVSYKEISHKELRDKREDLETVASNILESMQDEKQENSDTIQLEVQYLDIRKMTEDVYKKLKRIDTLEKAEVARRQAEEQRKKDDMSQKVKRYIDRVQRLTVFEPLTSRLTKNDEARIQSECIKANQFLIAENLTSTEIEKKCRELEEYVQIIYKKSKTWEEIEAERERERAETIRKRAEVINNLRAYISDVKSLVVFKQFKNRLTEEDFRLIFSQCNIAERHIRENSDTIQLEVQYLDIRKMTEHVYKKLERIDTLEKAEVARRQAEERIKKAEMSQKLKNYIDRVQRLTVFEPLTSRLTKHDEDRIQSECIKANQFLIAENLTSAEIEKKCRELEEYVQIIYKKLETREEKDISQKELRDKREDLETVASKILKSMQDEKQKRDRKIVREADECRMFISRVRSFAVFGEQRNKLTSEDIKSITRKCNELKGWLSSYPITEDEIEKRRTELIEFVERLRNRIKKEQQH